MITPLPLLRLAAIAVALFATVPPAIAAPNISPLAKEPDWQSLEAYHETMTRAEFEWLLQNVYCGRGVDVSLIQVEAETARIAIDRDEQTWFTLRFAKDEASRKPVPRSWRPAAALPHAPKGRELAGLKVTLDPGHIGGTWARMEERWFQVGDSKPIQEGDMTLLVAKLIAPQLRKLGATVSLVRAKNAPATPKRPDDLKEVSRKILLRAGNPEPRDNFEGPDDPQKEQTVRWQNERLFYRNSEIRQRAECVNKELRPDVVLCLHFNAETWDEPTQPSLTDRNHLHLLVNGAYLPDELAFDDVRFEMVQRLLTRTHEEELPLAEQFARTMAQRTQLPPYVYTTDNVTRVGETGYVYARNLIATRIYQAPVIYFEPYVMNSDEVFWRIQEGDYEGIRNVNGTDRPSIFREYADSVVAGLLEYHRAARAK